MTQLYCGGPVMTIDSREDDSPPKLERWLLRRVFGYFRSYWRRGALAPGWILGQSVRGLAPAVPDGYERVVERGTHRGLVEQNGLYATLYERHFRATADPDELTHIGA
jgi:hypothetical protein